MSVQVDNSYVANSNTHVNKRQPRQEDAQFSRVLNQIRATRQVVEDTGDIGDWKNILPDINAAALSNRLEATLEALARSNPRLSSILATLPDIDQDQAEQDTFKTFSEDEIEDFPDSKPMVSGLLQAATVSELFSESNTGKTFIALDLAEHVARGISWLGRNVKQGPVLYIYAESRLGLKPRILAWKKHHNLPSTPNLKFIVEPVQLVSEKERLLKTIEKQEVTPELVVIDTFSNCAEGINQNDQSEVYRVLATAHELVREYGCHVMVVHHTNKQGSANGSAAFKNHVDTMIELKRADKYSPIVMHCEKQRDAEQFDDIILQLEVVKLYINPETLEPVTSCVVVASSEPTAAARATETLEQEQQKMLAILQEHKRLSVNKWIAECKAVGISKAAYYQHIPHLKDSRKVIYQQPAKNGLAGFYELASSVEQASLETETTDSE